MCFACDFKNRTRMNLQTENRYENYFFRSCRKIPWKTLTMSKIKYLLCILALLFGMIFCVHIIIVSSKCVFFCIILSNTLKYFVRVYLYVCIIVPTPYTHFEGMFFTSSPLFLLLRHLWFFYMYGTVYNTGSHNGHAPNCFSLVLFGNSSPTLT